MSAEVQALLSSPIRSYAEWELFDARVTLLIQIGLLRPVEPLKCIHLPSEEWYIDPSDGELYVYVKPDDKIYPLWERIDPFAAPSELGNSRDLRIAGLRLVTPGPIQREVAMFLKRVIDDFAKESRIELLERADRPSYEVWCRELLTDYTYCLTINDDKQDYRWDRAEVGKTSEGLGLPN